jgi:hypothetical protein
MLENRASTNRLTAEIRNDLVDIVQECRTYIYRRYHQEAMNNALGTLATNRQPKAAPSSLRFADSQTGNTTSEASSQPQADVGVPMDHDPDVFESIFENEFQATLEAGYYDPNHALLGQSQCFCVDPCSCIPSSSSKNTLWMR